MEKYDLILANGILVTGGRAQKADVAVRGDRIAEVGPELSREGAARVIDVSGRYVLPGVLDVHVHPVYLDDVETAARCAAYGGTTTVLHFAYARTGESLEEQVTLMLEDATRRSPIDFGLHGGMFEASKQVPEIPAVMALGVRTFKFFLTYLKQGWYTDDYQLIKAMDLLAERGGMAMVHAENGGAIDYLEDKYLKGPNASAAYFNASRPPALEEEAIFRAICLAEVTACPLYIAHVTAARALRPIRQAQAEGRPVYAETCPQYFALTEDILKIRGAYAKIGPPIRAASDNAALWRALADGALSIVSSDHAPKKKDPAGDFLAQGFGSPQIETLLPITWDEGVNRGHISPVRLAQVLSENPARIFGLYPRKGTLQPGSDADIVVFDPNRAVKLTDEGQRTNVGYTLFAGREALGWPEMSFQRGQPVLWKGEVVAAPGCGKFLPTMETPVKPV